MYLLTFRDGDALKLGVRTAKGVVDVAAAQAALGAGDTAAPESMDALLAGGAGAKAALQALVERADAVSGGDWLRDEASLTLGPAVPNPGKIICVGLNYRKHAEESGMAIPTTPVLFSKFNNSLAAANEDVPLRASAKEYDYEVELGVIIGETASDVSEEDALGVVFGYATANDLSARDLQMRSGQWLLGKTLDKSLPIGPYLVTADDVPDPQALQIRTWHNGTLRQDSNTADMIFTVAELIAYITKHFTLEAGDVIVTGTPAGVILGLPEKNWIVAGDVVEVEVEGLGKLRNKLVAAG
jgi:2-keto-4-pentenoate hydratase/2-oxohepta-3-ene-1,7-dioic acid hydratase in catechol pathway